MNQSFQSHLYLCDHKFNQYSLGENFWWNNFPHLCRLSLSIFYSQFVFQYCFLNLPLFFNQFLNLSLTIFIQSLFFLNFFSQIFFFNVFFSITAKFRMHCCPFAGLNWLTCNVRTSKNVAINANDEIMKLTHKYFCLSNGWSSHELSWLLFFI